MEAGKKEPKVEEVSLNEWNELEALFSGRKRPFRSSPAHTPKEQPQEKRKKPKTVPSRAGPGQASPSPSSVSTCSIFGNTSSKEHHVESSSPTLRVLPQPIKSTPSGVLQGSSFPLPSVQAVLPDYIKPGLDLLFVGDNPGNTSAAKRRHFAHPSNHFWPLVFQSKIIPEKLGPQTDYRVLEFGVGLTCLCARPSATSSELSVREQHDGFAILKRKLQEYKPRWICFNGIGIARTVLKRTRCKIGHLGSTCVVTGVDVFVMPSTSARAKRYSFKDKLDILKQLKRLMDNAKK